MPDEPDYITCEVGSENLILFCPTILESVRPTIAALDQICKYVNLATQFSKTSCTELSILHRDLNSLTYCWPNPQSFASYQQESVELKTKRF